MSFGAVAVGIGGALIGASASRSAASSAADASNNAVAAQSAATADRLAFDKQSYADGAADRQFASDMARKTAANQEADRAKYNTLQDEQIARGHKYQAAEDQMLTDSENYDTPERREAEASRARSDATAGFTNAHDQMQRGQDRRGVNPSSGAAAALETQSRIAEATGTAGAVNNARKNVETQGYARKMDAIGLGKGLVGNQATQAGLQLQAGNSAVGNSVMPINIANSANGAMSAGFGNAAAGYGNLAATQMAGFNSAQAYASKIGSGVGNMFGSIFNKPGVTSGISDAAYRMYANNFTPDAEVPMQAGGGY